MNIVPGPDFPTAGIVYGRAGIVEAYKTGRGRVVIRSRTHFEESNNRTSLIIDELPYQVNKARLQEKIADLVKKNILKASRRFVMSQISRVCAW